MGEQVIAWDIETVPDLEAVARVHGLRPGEAEAAKEALGDKFPRHPFHEIVCIGAVIAEKVDEVWHVKTIGAPHTGDRSETDLITAFVDKVAALKPRLVSFNGHGFDLPVLRYRAMMHRIHAPGLSYRPYFHRYTDDAVDLCDVLASFAPGSKIKLDELCRSLNLPGKPEGIDGSQVDQYVRDGRIQEVADYCECDVISTYRLWLLHELFKGALTPTEYEQSEFILSNFITARLSDKPHWVKHQPSVPCPLTPI